jgi:hypothetical protein
MADRITGRGLSMKSKHPAHVGTIMLPSPEKKKTILNLQVRVE